MLKLFLSRSITQKLSRIKEFFKYNNKLIIFVIVVTVVIALADILFFVAVNSGYDEDEVAKIEEIVLSHEDEISEIACNYNLLTYNAQKNLELEFDDVKVKFSKESDEKLYLYASSNCYNKLCFSLNGDKLEKEENNYNNDYSYVVLIFFCFFIDLCIIAVSLLTFSYLII